MPLVAFALACYLAGLLAGFSDSLFLWTAVVGAAAAFGSRHGRLVGVSFAALATAGIVAAHEAERYDSDCVASATTASSLRVVLDDSASAGAFVRGRLAGCEAFVSIAVDEGEAVAGSLVVARGVILRSQRGFLIQHAQVRALAPPSLLRRARTAAGRAIDRTFREDAPLVKALLIADRTDLAPEVRDRFAAAGLAHILAIAGLHIGIIAAAIELALDLFGVPRRRASIITIVVIVGYVAMIGAPIPAVRSATMLTTLLMTRLAQRPSARWAIVAIGAMHPVIAPRVVLDAGYQLSVVGVAAMIAASQLGRRLGVHRLHWFIRAVAVTLLGTTIATIASAPIVAWVFGRVSLIAPLTNLAANPLIALAQPMIFCGLVLAPIGPIARFIADAAHPLLVGLNFVASTGAAAPGGAIAVAPTVGAAAIAGILSLAVIVACASREWMRPAMIALASGALLAWLPLAPSRAGDVELHMIDVGQGDAIALRTPHSHWILFDAGGAWRGGDAGRSTVLPYIGRRGGSLDMFVLSHPHTDHVGGAASVFRALHPRVFVDAGFPGGADAYRASLAAARAAGVRWVRAHPNDSLTIDGVSIRFLAPDSAWTASLVDPNLASVVTLVRMGDVRILFMGDAERPEEEWLLDHAGAELHADILKVGHHGSRTSSSPAFLDAVRPRVALVSVGAGNSYHLPTPSVMRELAAHGAEVLRTDRLGTIIARTDGRRIFIEAAGDTWELPRHSAPH
jgi:DNA internalization-related competence protein ComEC/Rec2